MAVDAEATQIDGGSRVGIAGAIPLLETAHLTEVRLGILVKASQSGVRPSSVKVPRPYSSMPHSTLLSKLGTGDTMVSQGEKMG